MGKFLVLPNPHIWLTRMSITSHIDVTFPAHSSHRRKLTCQWQLTPFFKEPLWFLLLTPIFFIMALPCSLSKSLELLLLSIYLEYYQLMYNSLPTMVMMHSLLWRSILKDCSVRIALCIRLWKQNPSIAPCKSDRHHMIWSNYSKTSYLANSCHLLVNCWVKWNCDDPCCSLS